MPKIGAEKRLKMLTHLVGRLREFFRLLRPHGIQFSLIPVNMFLLVGVFLLSFAEASRTQAKDIQIEPKAAALALGPSGNGADVDPAIANKGPDCSGEDSLQNGDGLCARQVLLALINSGNFYFKSKVFEEFAPFTNPFVGKVEMFGFDFFKDESDQAYGLARVFKANSGRSAVGCAVKGWLEGNASKKMASVSKLRIQCLRKRDCSSSTFTSLFCSKPELIFFEEVIFSRGRPFLEDLATMPDSLGQAKPRLLQLLNFAPRTIFGSPNLSLSEK